VKTINQHPREAALFLLLMVLTCGATGQDDPYPHNSVTCERCHSAPSKFGGSSMTVQRMGASSEGKFLPASEGGSCPRLVEPT
jgi:hypothetical protein